MPTDLKILDRDTFTTLLSSKTLGDPSVGPALPGASLEAGQAFAGEQLSVNVHGTLTVTAFNSADDVDPDGILALPVADAPVDKLAPQIAPAAGTAYLKYRAEAGIKSAVSGKALDAIGFAVSGGIDLILADYHRHPATTLTRAAVLQDITTLRTSLRRDDVLALTEGDAVSQQVAGRFSAAVEVSWSDVFTGPIGPLSALVASGASVLIKVQAGAKLKASVSVADDFVLVFSRVDAARWRIGLRKARTRQAALSVDAGVTVGFADPAQVTGILDAAIAGVLGETLATIDAVLAKATLADLSPDERRVADLLIARLGLQPALATIEAIKAKVAEVRSKVKGAVEDVAKAKVSLAFAYEYRRIRQDTTVAQCTLGVDGVKSHHQSLIRGRFDDVFAEASAGTNGAVLEHFLYQSTITSERSWGFTLSVGKWLTIGGKDKKKTVRVERHNAAGFVQRTFVGTRGYRLAGEARDRWSSDLSAAMPTFANGQTPRVSEFQTGLAFGWFDVETKLKASTLDQWLDLAVLWGALAEGEVAARRGALAAAIQKRCAVVAQLIVPHDAFALMRSRIAAASADIREFGAFLGAAMPFAAEAGRDSVALRRRLYGPLWAKYLSDPDNGHRRGRDFSEMARRHLAQEGFSALASREELYRLSSAPHDGGVFGGLIDLNPGTIQATHDFFNGVKRLNLAVLSSAQDNGTFGKVFEELENLWQQEHHVRAVGAYLLEIARATGTLGSIGRSLAITVDEGTPLASVVVIAR